MKYLNSLKKLQDKGIVSLIETEYVRYLSQLVSEENEEVFWAAAACMFTQRNGHVCLDFEAEHNQFLFNDKRSGIKFTDSIIKSWMEKLRKSELVSSGDRLSPLVLEDQRLYLQKYWKFEEELANWLHHKSRNYSEIEQSTIQTIHSIVEPRSDLFEINWQQVAIYLSFLKDLLVISGGPGTGKTHTVLSILASQILVNNNCRIALAAPTGKAARRLTESIENGKQHLPSEAFDKLKQIKDAVTVHKLLGSDFSGTRFMYNEKQKLPYDLVVVDEASMLDITMWIRLIRSLREHTKLIILGDKNQLASVEAGSILGDICQGDNTFSKPIVEQISKASGIQITPENNKPPINDCILFLTKSYRFDKNSGIQKFAEAVNNFDDDQAISILKDSSYRDIKWREPTEEVLKEIIDDYAVSHFAEYSQALREDLLNSSNKKKILCSVRNGPLGINRINSETERQIRLKKGVGVNKEWYSGRIIMATNNNNILKIKNGEIGVCSGTDASRLIFEGEQIREISSSRLNDYEPAYAITIHKSQGSEFDEVAILLSGSVKTILSKEILYTSVTRARKNTLIIGNEDTIRAAILHSVVRNSGLQQKVWEKI